VPVQAEGPRKTFSMHGVCLKVAFRCGRAARAVPHRAPSVCSPRWIASDSESDSRQAAADLHARSTGLAQTKPSDDGVEVAIDRSGLWSNPPHHGTSLAHESTKQPHTPLSRDLYNYIKASLLHVSVGLAG
jgi:hypothetical protein